MYKKSIILLTSRENFTWTSMQEIIPMIEYTWESYCRHKNHSLKFIDVDTSDPILNIRDLLKSDLIVITCFNLKIARYVKIIREKLQIDTQIFFYLHGLATIAMWPLERFGIIQFLNSNDLFIATCEGDIRSMKISFKNARTAKIAFTIIEPPPNTKIKNTTLPFIYIGRISPQKNLNLIIKAYSKLQKSIQNKHPLIFYGKEDNLGYPNLGITETNYLKKLKFLIKKLNIEEHCQFMGFIERERIQEIHGSNYVFISPSTHSDENFGMAAFRSLRSGVTCILSDWGGHKEFKSEYSEQILFLKARLSNSGPSIDIDEISKAMIKAISQANELLPKVSSYFNLQNIYFLLEKEINRNVLKKGSIIPTTLALEIFKQQREFEKNNEIQRCFKSFTDPAFIELFKAYSGEDF